MRRLLVLPLYPQYSGTTTASIFERVTAGLARWRWIPELRFVNAYHEEEVYVAAVAGSVAEHWRVHGRKHLLFSFHSIPQRYFKAGDHITANARQRPAGSPNGWTWLPKTGPWRFSPDSVGNPGYNRARTCCWKSMRSRGRSK